MVEIFVADRMWMRLEARKVGHPCKGCRIPRHDFLGCATGWKVERNHVYPGRTGSWSPFLIEKLAPDAVWIRHENIGSVPSAAQRAIGHGQVVSNEVPLGVAGLRKQHLVWVRDRHVTPVNHHELQICHHLPRPSVGSPRSELCRGAISTAALTELANASATAIHNTNR